MVVEDGCRVGRRGRVLGGDDDGVPVVERHAQRGGGRRRDRRIVAPPVEQGLEEGDAAGLLAALHLQLGQPVRLRHHQGVAVDGLPDGARHVQLGVRVARDRSHGPRCPARRAQMLGHHLPHHPAAAPVGLEHGVQRHALLRATPSRLARRVLEVAGAGRQPAEVLQRAQQVDAADLPRSSRLTGEPEAYVPLCAWMSSTTRRVSSSILGRRARARAPRSSPSSGRGPSVRGARAPGFCAMTEG